MIREIWDSLNSEERPDGRHVIKHTYVHRHNIQDTFPPWRSNVGEARNQAKRVIFKAKRQGNLNELEAQIEKMISKGAVQQLGEKEILELAEKPHLFTQYNWVHNPGSQSTPFRVITNTSAINSGTTVSIEQMSPSKILNPMTNALVRFSLYQVPLCADIAAAYHNILVDGQTALLRLFYWFHDPRGRLERVRVFKQATQAFGDTILFQQFLCNQ